MICPECHAEYRDGFTVCADCDVPLTPQLPAPPQFANSGNPSDAGERDPFGEQDPEDPFCALWEGQDPRICADLCSVLDDAGIPHRVLRQEAHIFRIRADSHIKIGVPFSLYEKAENAIGEAFGGEAEAHRLLHPGLPNRPLFTSLVQQALNKGWQEEKTRSPFFSGDVTEREPQAGDENSAVAEESSPNHGPAYASEAGDERNSESLTQEVWRGTAIDTGHFIASCLNENSIRFSSAIASEDMRIFVSNRDQVRAREIVREILEGTPPE
jgi:hypothetical protein